MPALQDFYHTYLYLIYLESAVSQRMLLIAAITLATALLIYALSPFWFIMVAAGTLLGLGIGLIDVGINTYLVQDSDSAKPSLFLDV